jgi:hypothetical protein
MKIEDFRQQNSEIVQELNRQLAEKDDLIKNYRKEHGKLAVFFDQVTKSITPIEPVEIRRKKSLGTSVAVPVLHISDSHMGAVQDPNEIEGFNAFNPDICRRRNIEFVSKAVEWVELHKQAYAINKIAVMITGDLISGDIHDELIRTNAFPSPVQVVEAAKIHAQQISILCSMFDSVTVHFIVEDNHSRLTRKPQAKEAALNSFNYLVAELMAAYLGKHNNLEFNVYPMLEKVVEVNGMKYLITHGHTVKGWMGVPWYGIERKVGKESQARMQLIMQDIERAKTIGFHKYLHGHFHTPFDGDLYCCSGSVQGTDAYDHQAGRYARPSQPAWMVGKRGEFNRTNFKLDHIN